MRNSFVRYFVGVVLFVSLSLGVAPVASAAAVQDPTTEPGFREAIVRIVRVVRQTVKKNAGRIMSNADVLATPRP
ncbi:MAG: hypothetical protein QOJ98_591 [Acidobacteriota bacterium]|jgi:hypothetical protein|nr:hypothetical protein [Acidobacteriota bacterium]